MQRTVSQKVIFSNIKLIIESEKLEHNFLIIQPLNIFSSGEIKAHPDSCLWKHLDNPLYKNNRY